MASPQSVSRSASWQGSGAGITMPGRARGRGRGRDGIADLRRPKRIRRRFSRQFSRAFCPNRDRFWQNARENWPALGIPAGRNALYGKGPFLAQGMLRPPGNRKGKTRPTRGLRCTGAFREQSGRTGGGRPAPPSFGRTGRPRMGMTSIWLQRFISVRRLSSALEGAVGACGVGRCVAAGLRVPDMEATRDRTPEAEGWVSRRAFEPGRHDGPGPMV